tara:strand:+ start:65 stop:607 length:543 start_codon:yes stop_codon:yes gene_type:complete
VKITYSTLLACIAALLFWLTIAGDPPRQEIASATDDNLRQSYLENAHRWRYDLQGERIESIHLSTASRFVNSPMTQLGALEYRGRDNKGQHWTLTAGGGLLQENQDELRLNQGVRITERSGDSVLLTSHLRVLLREERATTGAQVTLTTPEGVTTARGLDVDLKTDKVRLLHDVESTYEG